MKLFGLIFALLAVSTALAGPVEAARGVLRRTLGERAAEFELRLIPKDGADSLTYHAERGRVVVEATSGVGLARGAYLYLKQATGSLVVWEGKQLRLPRPLPDWPRTTIVSPFPYRHYFNVCTFGYTMAFWGWREWERELDWMALHGINLPLAMTGTEAVWQEVWRSYGLSDEEIRQTFTGPAYLPWHRMGNLNSHAGPLPQRFIDHEARLQRRILGRMRELGMMPITPGFAGFIPPGLARRFPQARVTRTSPWAGFEPTFWLSPDDPLFADITRRYLRAYRSRYGPSRFYLIDLFNEMQPTFPNATRLADLTRTSQRVLEAHREIDPRAVWVMQGWKFFHQADFWKQPESEAFLGAIPDEAMLLLDLHAEVKEIWRENAAFRRKPWIWNVLHNFGQTTPLEGRLPTLASRPAAALADSDRGLISGMGMTMEGTHQNAIVYELMADVMDEGRAIALEPWLAAYVRGRYGIDDPELQTAWRDLLNLTYRRTDNVPSFTPYQLRPRRAWMRPAEHDPAVSRGILRRLLTAADRLRGRALYRRDLVDVAKRVASDECGVLLWEITRAGQAGDTERVDGALSRLRSLLLDLDTLLATLPEYRLETWIAAARRLGSSTEEKKLMELNARMQITVWGRPVVYDYARKEWSGLVREVYLRRWETFARGLLAGKTDDEIDDEVARADRAWCEQTTLSPSRRVELIAAARRFAEEEP